MGIWMVFGGLLMLLFWAVIIGLVVWGIAILTKHYSPGSDSTEKRDSLGIAKERYARGQISREQFEQIKSDLLVR
jgi:putative membrane protein